MIESCCGPLNDRSEPIKTSMTYCYILDAFPRLGRAPTLKEMEENLLLQKNQIMSILDSLVAKGSIRVEPTSYIILDAYPYSGVPTRHRVYLDNGRILYCMCAVDTFYVPFITGSDITIRSHCFYCRTEIEIYIEQHKISRVKPSHSVVWNSTAPYDCPMTNFFCCKEHLLKWREKNPDESGQIYTLDDAFNAGKRHSNHIIQLKEGLNEVLWAKANELVCYCREVPKATIVAAIMRGATNLKEIQKETIACTGGWCKDTNPKMRCCQIEIEILIEAYLGKRDDNVRSVNKKN